MKITQPIIYAVCFYVFLKFSTSNRVIGIDWMLTAYSVIATIDYLIFRMFNPLLNDEKIINDAIISRSQKEKLFNLFLSLRAHAFALPKTILYTTLANIIILIALAGWSISTDRI